MYLLRNINRRILPALASAAAAALLATASQAAPLYSFSTTKASSAGYDPSVVTVTSADHISGPSAAELPEGDHGLIRFQNSAWNGFSLIGTGSTQLDFSTGYFELTVTADPGYTLNLTSLDFLSARGGTTGTRLFQIYAAVDGAAFDQNTDLIREITSSGDGGTRTNPASINVDLTDAKYQDISSVTFRYYPLTDQSGRSIEFNNFEVQGSVIPEPATLSLIGLGGVLLIGRRRARKR